MMDSKKCTSCYELKQLSGFGHRKTAKDGLRSNCKKCEQKMNSEYERSKNGLVKKIYSNQKLSSKRRGHPKPNYNLDELRKWVFNQLNFEELYNNWVNSGYARDLAPSCDRSDDYLGYDLDRLELMSWKENRNKGHSDRRNGVNNKMNKAVIQMDKLGNYVNRFYSVMQANRATRVAQESISNYCNRKLKSADGFCWMFEIQAGVNHG